MLDLLTRGPHVRERAARAALRHSERARRRSSAACTLDRPEPLGPARQGRRADGDVVRQPHVAGAARRVDSGEHHWARRRRRRRRTSRRSRRTRKARRRRRCASSMEQHRAKPSCNACHGVMDPLGFALENFDAIGAWRAQGSRRRRRRSTRRASSSDGTPVNGPGDLRKALLARPEQFVQTLTEKLMTYALGPQRRVLRHAGRARDRARRGARRLPVLVDRDGHRRRARRSRCSSVPSSRRRARRRDADRVERLRRSRHVHHQEASVAPHVPARRRRDASACRCSTR